MPVKFSFSGKNPEAQKVAKQRAAKLVTRVSKDAKAAIREVIVSSIRDGVQIYDAARSIQKVVGLTSRQAAAVKNYRNSLLDSGLTLEKVNKLSDRYAEKQLRERARTIARTETMEALNGGMEESWKQARKDGWIGRDATKEVIVTPDDALCPVCEPLDGVAVPLSGKFETDDGEFSTPPFHPRCRCTIALNPGEGIAEDEEVA